MAGSSLSPFNIFGSSNSFQIINTPIVWIVAHVLKNPICFAHVNMILYVIAENKSLQVRVIVKVTENLTVA